MKQNTLSLGESLVAEGLLQPDQLKRIEGEIKLTHEPFQKVLKRLRIIDEKRLVSFLSTKFNIPEVQVTHQVIKPEVLKLIPENLIRRFLAVPIRKIGKQLTVVMADPLNLGALDQLRLKSGFDIVPAVSTETEIRNAIEQYYGLKSDISDVLKSMNGEPPQQDSASGGSVSNAEGTTAKSMRLEDAPIIKIVNTMIAQAVRDGASDIHVAPEKDAVLVRYRIDGILHKVDHYPKDLHPGVISRVKVIANMDIAETRAPQDGRVRLDIDGLPVDLRISVLPTVHGENLVIRLLRFQAALLSLEKIGMSPGNLASFREIIQKPYGILLITGPTGSGKSTTLYTALSQINSPDKNIITIEDPVEYQLPLIRQTQVNPAANLTFATGLRSILRQDPDVIMVGEIRDKETGEIAIQAALTGHLVFSTLHTNNASAAVTRLEEMGIQPFLIASTIVCVIAQRLVRKICSECKVQYDITDSDREKFGLIVSGAEKEIHGPLYRGKGCLNCKKTGYKGRSGIFEVLVPDQEIRKLILKKSSSEEIEKLAIAKGMHTLCSDGLEKIKSGVTTVDEVLRVTQEVM